MPKVEVKVGPTDQLLQAAKSLARNFATTGKEYVSIGWDAESGTYPDGLLVAQVAIFNEFGTYRDGRLATPARPFMGPTYRENKKTVREFITKQAARIATGKTTGANVLDAVGFRMLSALQRKIRSNIAPRNAPSTIKNKRSHGRPAVTLVNTGRMLRTARYRLHGVTGFALETAMAGQAAKTANDSAQTSAAAAQGRVSAAKARLAKKQALMALRRQKKLDAAEVRKDRKALMRARSAFGRRARQAYRDQRDAKKAEERKARKAAAAELKLARLAVAKDKLKARKQAKKADKAQRKATKPPRDDQT